LAGQATEESKEDNGAREETGGPSAEAESNIPVSPPAISSVLQSDKEMEDGYDSDGECGPFYDAVADEGSQEVDEEAVEEIRELEVGAMNGTEPLNGENVAGNATQIVAGIATQDNGRFVDIPTDDLEKMKVKELKEELSKRGQSVKGKKEDLFARLKESLKNRHPVLNTSDKEARKTDNLEGFAPTARWKPLVPIPEPLEDPNTNPRFRAPTIPANEAAFVPTKHNYVELFDRRPFGGRSKKPVKLRNGRPKRDKEGNVQQQTFVRERGGPNPDFLLRRGLTVDSSPQDWFKAFLPIYDGTGTQAEAIKNCFTHKWASFLNTKAVMLGAGTGSGLYPTFKPFSHKDIEKHLALYFVNGLNPSPQVEMKICHQNDDPIQGSDLCYNSLGGSAGIKRHKHFKAFFCIQDPLRATPSKSTRPNHKVDNLLRHMQQISMQAWDLGPDIAIDEQTIGFQGRHKDKLRITYKNEGDGFQCDAVCDSGFTFTFYFRNQPAPKKYIDKGLSPLHARVMSMFDQLKDEYHNCWFDNLYLSARFANAAFNHEKKVRISGPTRKGGRGLPQCVIQEEVKNPNEIRAVRGTVKAAVLVGDPKIPDLVSVSFYDQKPVHFLSTICKSIKWIQLERQVYNVDTDKCEKMKFLRLNLNDAYNRDMGHVDISDQLRNSYRFDHWMRKRKWWWSFFFWGIGVLLVNAYVSYRALCREKKVKPMSQYDFRKAIALAWMDQERYWPDRYKNVTTGSTHTTTAEDDSITDRSRNSKRLFEAGASINSVKKRSAQVTTTSLCPRIGCYKFRLGVGFGQHLVERGRTGSSQCALHYWAKKETVRAWILHCPTCHVHLCIQCWKPWHTIQEVEGLQAHFEGKISGDDGGTIRSAKSKTAV
jgi:hypothetical protein